MIRVSEVQEEESREYLLRSLQNKTCTISIKVSIVRLLRVAI